MSNDKICKLCGTKINGVCLTRTQQIAEMFCHEEHYHETCYVDWMVERLRGGAGMNKEMIDAAKKTHDDAVEAAWKAYCLATAPARKTYNRATSIAWKNYTKALEDQEVLA